LRGGGDHLGEEQKLGEKRDSPIGRVKGNNDPLGDEVSNSHFCKGYFSRKYGMLLP